jgi:di/tricarboxylate transporter
MQLRPLPKFSRKQWTGFICIYLAGLGWLTDIIVPFTGLPHKPQIFAVALGFAEIMFITGVAFLGKAYYKQIKVKLIENIKKPRR